MALDTERHLCEPYKRAWRVDFDRQPKGWVDLARANARGNHFVKVPETGKTYKKLAFNFAFKKSF